MGSKVGLALGSGASRGWAHIGIIDALQQLDIEIDFVAGCSIGSYVGAAFCANKLAELEEWVRSLTEWQVTALLGLGWHKGGIVSGEKVFQKLAEDFTAENLEDLEKPLGIIATDLQRGREAWFTEGSTVKAVRASCSIPGLFPAYHYQDKWLVDGGVMNPVPVNLVREMGADIVIAVNLGSDFNVASDQVNQVKNQEVNDTKLSQLLDKSRSTLNQWFEGKFTKDEEVLTPPSMFSTMNTSLNIMQDWLTRSKLASDPPNITLAPKLGHVGIMEFHRASECIEIGKKTVERMAEQIKYEIDMHKRKG
jgi:NTE family protein